MFVLSIPIVQFLQVLKTHMLKISCYLNNNKILWSWAWPQQIQLSQDHLVCAVVAGMPFPDLKPCLRLLAALFSFQTLFPILPGIFMSKSGQPGCFHGSLPFPFPSPVRNIANGKMALALFCSLTVVAGLSGSECLWQ